MRRAASFLTCTALVCGSLFALMTACSGDESNRAAGGAASSGGSGAAAGASGSGGNIGFDAGHTGGDKLNEDAACAQTEAEATLVSAPVDVIVVIDNSGSMGQEIVGVQDNINQNFATILDNAGLDYRVIMLSEHGEAIGPESVCIEAPLSGIPVGGCTPAPAQPVDNPPKFFHHSVPISSHNSWCQVLAYFSQADEFGNHPNGYQDLLRPEAVKFFVGDQRRWRQLQQLRRWRQHRPQRPRQRYCGGRTVRC